MIRATPFPNVTVEFAEANLRQNAGGHKAGKYLLVYVEGPDTILVDSSAPARYKELAALHMSIYFDKQKPEWVGELDDEDAIRCAQIDHAIANQLTPTEVIEYIGWRTELYYLLSSPTMSDSAESVEQQYWYKVVADEFTELLAALEDIQMEFEQTMAGIFHAGEKARAEIQRIADEKGDET